MAMTLGSLFDGIGGWPDAALLAGIKPLWASEIEPFPAAVTAHHYPEMKQLGDITKINVDELEPVDIICAGSPCQDLSVAGKRKGLSGERSGLFSTAIDIVHRLRERTGKPRFFVWENVPGAFSSNGGLILEPCLRKSDRPKFQCLNVTSGHKAEWCSATNAKLRGEYWTLNIGESPNVAKESFLSQILQPPTDVQQKYYLSSRAVIGILRRAKERGKKLPEKLEKALIAQAEL